MRIDILTLFPNLFSGPLSESILKRAQEKNLIEINIHNIRDVTNDTHHTVDDTPYGGGPGMVMRVDILDFALQKLIEKGKKERFSNPHIILMSPQGKTLNQSKAKELSKKDWLIFICAHYEGFDARIENFIDEEISIGDYILTGGEIPAMVVIDSTCRLIPGVIGKIESTHEESFQNNLLEYPQYTRPDEYKGMKVPEILKSGHHREIADWRHDQSLIKTKEKRPDLLGNADSIDKTE